MAELILGPSYLGYPSIYMRRRLHDNTSSCHVSAIEDHVTSTGHNLKWDHFDIFAKVCQIHFARGLY